jgi:hypothetical protein
MLVLLFQLVIRSKSFFRVLERDPLIEALADVETRSDSRRRPVVTGSYYAIIAHERRSDRPDKAGTARGNPNRVEHVDFVPGRAADGISHDQYLQNG